MLSETTNQKSEVNGEGNIMTVNVNQISASLSQRNHNLLFLLMGMGALAPFNTFITCVDYFSAINPEENDVPGQITTSNITALLITTLILLPLSLISSTGTANSKKEKISSKLNTTSIRRESELLPSEEEECEVTTIKKSHTTSKVPNGAVLRIFTGYLLTLVLLCVLASLPAKSQTLPTLNRFSFFVGVGDAIIQSGLYSYAASYNEPSYSVAVTLGSAFSGFIISLFRLSTRNVFLNVDDRDDVNKGQNHSDDDNQGSIDGWNHDIYLLELRKGVVLLFFLSVGVLIICILALAIITRAHYQQLKHQEGEEEGENSATNLPDNHISSEIEIVSNPLRCSSKIGAEVGETTKLKNHSTEFLGRSETSFHYRTDKSEIVGIDNRSCVGSSRLNERWIMNSQIGIYFETLKITWKPTLSAFLNFFITLSLFPGIVVSMPSFSNSVMSLGDWLPVVMITIFNSADVLGRACLWNETWPLPRALLSKSFYRKQQNHLKEAVSVKVDQEDSLQEKNLLLTPPPSGHELLANYDMLVWYPTLSRIIFFPLVILCIVPSSPYPFITSDLIKCLIVFLLGLTNGFVQCANFMATPTMLEIESQRDASSLLLLLAIYLGLTCGAYFGLLIDSIINTS